MLSEIKKLFSLFNKKERQQIYWLLSAILVMGLIETTGVVSIMPFMAVVADPSIIENNKNFQAVYNYLNFGTTNQFLFFLGVLVLLIITISNTFSAFITWLMLRFSNLRGHALSERLLANYLQEPYVFYLNRNSAELSKNLFQEVSRVINGILMPLMSMLMKFVTAFFILTLLLLINPTLALTVVLALGVTYVIVYIVVRGKLSHLGHRIVQLGVERFKSATEAFGGIKDIKLLGKETEFLSRYSIPSRQFSLSQASSQIITQIPRYALEVIAFGGILLIVLYLINKNKNLNEVLPLMGLYAFAGYRLMPSLQQIFSGIATVRNTLPSLQVLYTDLTRYAEQSKNEIELISVNVKYNPLSFNNNINLDGIIYRYPNTREPVIQDLNVKIQANTTVGIVGGTGSGKTTMVDIILGLLTPEFGKLEVDDINISDDNMAQWKLNLGYVPQSIYLTDDTIKKNIAFGVPENEIDIESVNKATSIANIHKFIHDELPDGLDTLVGERGVRLSGGQRQRIGIARALYRNPKVLILDEATSALDGETENAIIEAINKLAHKKTIIMIAHRLTTVMTCDVIHLLEKGKIVESGTYSRLIQHSKRFQKLANVDVHQ